MSCRSCKWLDVKPDKAGRRRIYRDNAYVCTVPISQPILPTSVLENRDFQWPPQRTYMFASIMDRVCLLWEKYQK